MMAPAQVHVSWASTALITRTEWYQLVHLCLLFSSRTSPSTMDTSLSAGIEVYKVSTITVVERHCEIIHVLDLSNYCVAATIFWPRLQQ